MKNIFHVLLLSLLTFAHPVFAEPQAEVSTGKNIETAHGNTMQVDVRSFGAKGDGVVDDSNAFKKALQALQVTGGTIYVPKGTYIVGLDANWANGSSSGWLNSSGRTYAVSFRIYGDGPSSIIKAKPGVGHAMLFDHPKGDAVTPTDFNKRWIIVEDLAIDANGEPYGLEVKSGAGIKVRNCSIYNNTAVGSDKANAATSGGIYIDGSGMYRFENLFMRPNNSAAALNINDSAGDGSISGCDIAAGFIGILMKNCSGDTRVFNNVIYNQFGYSIMTTGDLQDNNQVNIFGNQLAEAGIAMISANEGSARGAVDLNIQSNVFWMNGSQGSGILLGKVYEFLVADNKFPWIRSGVGNGKYAIRATSAAANGVIARNIINKLEPGGTGIAIGGSKIKVADNTLFNVSDTSSTSFVTVSNAVDLVQITGNVLPFYGLVKAYALQIEGTPTNLNLNSNIFSSGNVTAYANPYRSELSNQGVFSNGGFKLIDSAWNLNPLVLNDVYIWPSSTKSGMLYVKNGAPASSSDGGVLSQKVGVPSSAKAQGLPGHWSADPSYLYIYTGDGTNHSWKRSAISPW